MYIDGQAGTTGLRIRDRLAGRDDVELLEIDPARRKDPQARRECLRSADVAILCPPDAAAREAVALLDGARTRVLDASTAHRVADGWVFGPLVDASLLSPGAPISVPALSGYSGGGRAMIERWEDPATGLLSLPFESGAGVAIQNLNLMLGVPEATGLRAA